MRRFAKNFVAIQIEYDINKSFVINDADNIRHYIDFRGVVTDNNMRLVGKVIGYDKRKRYIVKFSPQSEPVQIKVRNCYEPNLNKDNTLLPANNRKPKVKVVAEMVKTPAWFNGELREVYLKGKEVNGAKAKIFVDNNDKLNVIAGRTFLDDRNILYFLEN